MKERRDNTVAAINSLKIRNTILAIDFIETETSQKLNKFNKANDTIII